MTIRTIGMPSSSSATQAVERMAEQASGRPGARRTVEQLLVAAARQAAVRKRAAAEKAERERQRLARARSAARARYLDGLVGHGHVDELWQRAEALITTRRPVDYDAAVKVMQDLHDLAVRQEHVDTFAPRLQELCARHAKKVSLRDWLDKAQIE